MMRTVPIVTERKITVPAETLQFFSIFDATKKALIKLLVTLESDRLTVFVATAANMVDAKKFLYFLSATDALATEQLNDRSSKRSILLFVSPLVAVRTPPTISLPVYGSALRALSAATRFSDPALIFAIYLTAGHGHVAIVPPAGKKGIRVPGL